MFEKLGMHHETYARERELFDALPQEKKDYVALVNGKRDIFAKSTFFTHFCYSNPDARKSLVDFCVEYAQQKPWISYLHLWLADYVNNNCECENCVKMTPSDWYVMLLNDIDAELTRRGLNNRIGAIMYSETAYEPTCEHINNPDRFLFLLGAITRSYTYSVPKNPKLDKLTTFELNKSGRPETMEEHIIRADKWRGFAGSPTIAYEYHFWKHQFYAPGVLSFARRLYEDVHSYKANGFNGIIEDGSQRSFFPNGLSYYVYAATLFDNSVDFDQVVEDYCRHAYGELWQTAIAYLKAMDEYLPQTYVEARHTLKVNHNKHYDPSMEEKLLAVEGITREFEEKFAAHRNMPCRVQTVSVRLLTRHMEFCRGLAAALALKCVGKDTEAKAAAIAFEQDFGKYEVAMERYYDHMIAVHAFNTIFNTKSEYAQ